MNEDQTSDAELEQENSNLKAEIAALKKRIETRPHSNRAQIASAICSFVAIFIASFGLIGLRYQVASYSKAAQVESDRRVRDEYSKLYPMDVDIWKFIGQNPKLTKAFIDDKDGAVVSKMSEDERACFNSACQMFGDIFEYYLMLEPDLKGNAWADKNNCWTGYMEMIFKQSSGFRDFIAATKPEWTETFNKRFKEIGDKNGP